MRLERLQMVPLEIPFRTSFKHASADRTKTASVWVEAVADEGRLGHGEGCPREYVTGESVESAMKWFEHQRAGVIANIQDLESLKTWVEQHAAAIDNDPAAWCAVELAILDLLGQEAGQPVESILSLPQLAPAYQYSAVLGDGPTEVFQYQVQKYLKAGFRDFKIKLSGVFERDQEKLACLNQAGLPLRIRADANNLWKLPSKVIDHVERLDSPFWAIEEPVAARDFEGLRVIGNALNTRIILDESLTSAQDMTQLAASQEVWVLNLRVSKLGGVIRSLRLIEHARATGLQVIVGAHVGESSLLARAGLTLATAAGEQLMALEGAFGTHLLEQDICKPTLMFGEGGILRPQDWNLSGRAGWGLEAKSVG